MGSRVPHKGLYYHRTGQGRLTELYFSEKEVWIGIEKQDNGMITVTVSANCRRIAKFYLEEEPWFTDYRELEHYIEAGASVEAILRMILHDLTEPLRKLVKLG
jgi:hypothetical protein